MNIQEIKDRIVGHDLRFNLYFSRKLRNGYTSYAPNIDNQIFEDLTNLIVTYLERFLDIPEIDFNPTGYTDGTIETCSYDYVGNYQEVLSSFEIADAVDTEVDPDNFTFYCLEIHKPDDPHFPNFKFFRRVTKFKKLHSKGLIARFNGNQLNKLETKLIGIDGEVDFICVNDKILVLSHYSLERIFRLEEKFKDSASDFLSRVESENCISNYDQFFEDCMRNGNIRKTLTKMTNENIDIVGTFENATNIETTIDMFDLQIEVEKDPEFKIVYDNRDQIMDILRILRDAYYKSIINNAKGIDDRK